MLIQLFRFGTHGQDNAGAREHPDEAAARKYATQRWKIEAALDSIAAKDWVNTALSEHILELKVAIDRAVKNVAEQARTEFRKRLDGSDERLGKLQRACAAAKICPVAGREECPF